MFTRILVPTDFSAPSDIALEYARTLARHFAAKLHVLHVIEETPLESALGAEALVPPTPAVRTERLQNALERLSHRITEDDRRELAAKTEVVFGKPSHTIVDYASDNGFDLIVMGTHGREGIAHLLMGSVAELVVRSARCPVMTVHEGQVEPRVLAKARRMTATIV
jgi:nucleotide-binding universal stress UspA family protein